MTRSSRALPVPLHRARRQYGASTRAGAHRQRHLVAGVHTVLQGLGPGSDPGTHRARKRSGRRLRALGRPAEQGAGPRHRMARQLGVRRGLATAHRLAGTGRRLPDDPGPSCHRRNLEPLGRSQIRCAVSTDRRRGGQWQRYEHRAPVIRTPVGVARLVVPHAPRQSVAAASSGEARVRPRSLAQRSGRVRCMASRTHRLSHRRCRHATAGRNRSDAQPGSNDHRQFPGERPTDRLALG